MRVLLLADIHSNQTALDAVVADAGASGGFDAVWCLGDVVGYGPDPAACIEFLRSHNAVCIAGNHDLGALGQVDVREFNPVAQAAVQWTADRLSEADAAYLAGLPSTVVQGPWTLVHGTPRDPVWEYLLDADTVSANLPLVTTPWLLVGHSHLPLVFVTGETGLKMRGRMLRPGETVRCAGDTAGAFNPGSVGQPRDADPRAAYALLDTEVLTVTHRRVAYDIAEVQARIRAAGLPEPLAARLEVGR